MKAKIFSLHHFAMLLLVSTLLWTSRSFCQVENGAGGATLSVRGSVGFAYLPLSAWTDFWKEEGSFYQRNNPNAYYALSVYYSLSPVHSVSIGSELLRSSASLTTDFGAVEWRFQGIPITVGYEIKLYSFNQSFSAVAGLGASYFLSKLTSRVHSTIYPNEEPGERSGRGYGVHVSAALLSTINESVAMVTQSRYRYSDGMAFTDKSGDVKVEFTDFDLSVGLAWTF